MLVKAEAKQLRSASAFSVSYVTRSPVSFSSGPTFSLACLLSPMYLQKPFLFLTSLATFNSSWALSFLISSLGVQTMSLYPSQVTCFFFHPPYASFLCLSLSRSSLFIHTGLLAFLPYFLFVEMDLSGAWRRQYLNFNQLSWAHLLSRALIP